MSSYKAIDPSQIPINELHGLLLSAVAPRPIAFASTINASGQVNLSPFSFFNVFSANPPIMIFSPARRVRDNTTKHTYQNVKEVPEVVVNIVNYPMVEQMSLASTEYDQGVDEFTKSGFSPLPSTRVKPPRVKESPVAFECSVDKVIELGSQGGAGNLIICKVQLIHIQNQYLGADDNLDTTKLDLVARMGGSWYCRARPHAMFQIPKPLRSMGMGVDQLPQSVVDSSVLTGNDLGRLGNVDRFPSESAVNAATKDPEVHDTIEKFKAEPAACVKALHNIARSRLAMHQTDTALAILLYADSLLN